MKCTSHPKRDVVEGRTLCSVCLDRMRKYNKERRRSLKSKRRCTTHADRPASRGKTVCDRCLERAKDYQRGRTERAHIAIALAHGTQVECQHKLHPNIPEELRIVACWGHLEIDHPLGGGLKDVQLYGSNAARNGIVMGRRDPKDYFLLCLLHQLWNR
jgi:hypothetical protein